MGTWMTLRGNSTVPRSSLVLHCSMAMITFLYLISLTHHQLYQWGEMQVRYSNKIQILQRLILYSHKCAGDQGISLGAAVLYVLVELCFDLFFGYCSKSLLYVHCVCEETGKWHNFPPPVSCILFSIAPPHGHVLPRTLWLWKRKHGEGENGALVPNCFHMEVACTPSHSHFTAQSKWPGCSQV